MTFKREYYSGLNYQEAEHLVGKKVQFSDNAEGWFGPAILTKIFPDNQYKFRSAHNRWTYIRTCSETYPQKTIKIGEHELPMPLIKPLAPDTEYFLFVPESTCGYEEEEWSERSDTDMEFMEAGLAHETEKNAKIWASWWDLVVRGQMDDI